MKLLFAELKKLRQNRICLACLAGLVLVNLFLLWTRVRPLEGRAPAAAYRAIARELDGLSAEEQLALVEQQLEQTSALYKIEQILRVAAASAQGGDQLRAQNADLFEQYGDLYQEEKDQLWKNAESSSPAWALSTPWATMSPTPGRP